MTNHPTKYKCMKKAIGPMTSDELHSQREVGWTDKQRQIWKCVFQEINVLQPINIT